MISNSCIPELCMLSMLAKPLLLCCTAANVESGAALQSFELGEQCEKERTDKRELPLSIWSIDNHSISTRSRPFPACASRASITEMLEGSLCMPSSAGAPAILLLDSTGPILIPRRASITETACELESMTMQLGERHGQRNRDHVECLG